LAGAGGGFPSMDSAARPIMISRAVGWKARGFSMIRIPITPGSGQKSRAKKVQNS